MLIPYRVDVPMYRRPIANAVILVLAVVVFGFEIGEMSSETLESMILFDWSISGLLGHMWLHLGVMHLVGNMLFLWVFGNAVCAKQGNLAYPLVYVALGVIAGMTHLVFDGGPALGASGAINGVVGMYLFWYPRNDVSCFAWFFGPRFFRVSSIWMILLWLGFDLLGLATGGAGVAYYAHIGGLVAGVAIAAVATWFRWVDIEEGEEPLPQLLGMPWTYKDAARPMSAAPEPARAVPAARLSAAPRVSSWPPPRPSMPSAARPSAPAPIELAPADDSIRFRCACGKSLRCKSTLAGVRVKCPACGMVAQVPGV